MEGVLSEGVLSTHRHMTGDAGRLCLIDVSHDR